MPLILRQYLLFEVFFKVFANNKDYLSEPCLDGILDGIVHDGFTIRAKTIELFQPTIAASHACGE